MKKTLSSMLIAIVAVTLMPVQALAFTDVSQNHKYADGIFYLRDKGIIGGYPDGSYKPGQSVSRVEAMKIIAGSAKLIGPLDAKISNEFNDVSDNEWYTPWVLVAKFNGVVKGYSDGSFGVTKNINLAEAMKIITKAYQVDLPETVTQNPYNDVPKDEWFAPYFAYAKANNILEVDANGNVRPDQIVNRGLLADIMYKILKNRENKVPKLTSGDPNDVIQAGNPNLTREYIDKYIQVVSFLANSPILKKDKEKFYELIKEMHKSDPEGTVKVLKDIDSVISQILTLQQAGMEETFRNQMEQAMRFSVDSGGASEDTTFTIELIDRYNKVLAQGTNSDFTMRDAISYIEYITFNQSLYTGNDVEIDDEMMAPLVGIVTEMFKKADPLTQQYMTSYKSTWSNFRFQWQYVDEDSKRKFKHSYVTYIENQLAQQQQAYQEAQKTAQQIVNNYQEQANQIWNDYNVSNYTQPSYTQNYMPAYTNTVPTSANNFSGEMSDSTYNAVRNALNNDFVSSMNTYDAIDGSADSYWKVVDPLDSDYDYGY